MKYQTLFLQLLLLCNFLSFSCNSGSITGVYAGVELRISTWAGGAMERDDIVLYFRPDGTFTNDLKDANWKTAVKGTFKVNGSEVMLRSANGKKTTYKITSKGYLSGGNFVLLPLTMKGPIPASSFQYKGGSSAGGIGTNQPYVGTFSQNTIHFDGKGHFSHSRHSTVMISGDNIGGGTNNKEDDAGTYAYNDGMLTLKYNTGKSQTQSFFFTQAGEQIAVVNGRIYTKYDGKGKPASAATKPSARVPAATELVAKAREAHGGTALDAIRNLKVISQSRGILMVSQSDYLQPRTLAEARASGKQVYTEYWNGQQGWMWLQGKKTPLTPERIRDKEANRYAGLSGLHTQRLATLRKGEVEALRNGGYALSYTKEGARLKLILDSKYRVVGEEIPAEGGTMTIRYSNFRNVKGVLLPFTETQTKGSQTNEVKFTDYLINELEEKDWMEPSMSGR